MELLVFFFFFPICLRSHCPYKSSEGILRNGTITGMCVFSQGGYLEIQLSFRYINSDLFAFKVCSYFYSCLLCALVYLCNGYLHVLLKTFVVLEKMLLKSELGDSLYILMELI